MWGLGVLPATLPAPFSATLSPALSVYLCMNVGPQGLLVVRLPAPFVPHSASLGPATATRVLSALGPVSAPPAGLDVCFFFDLLDVGLPCRSIFCQFWLCEEVQCVYLHPHLGSVYTYILSEASSPQGTCPFQHRTALSSVIVSGLSQAGEVRQPRN